MKQLQELKIFFMGTPHFAAHTLAHLLSHNVPIHTVITQPDRPFGRKKELMPSAVKELALQQKIPVQQFEKLNETALEFFLAELPDLIVVVAYGLILPKTLIELPAYGCINVHGSLLPELRGPSPIQTALLQGLKETGTTIMLMDEKMDNGDILSQEKVFIDQPETHPSLEQKLLTATQKILIPTLEKWVNNEISAQPQDSEKATYTKIISKQDGRIVWANTAEDIYHQYQAYYRWPKVHAYWNQSSAHRSPLPAPGEVETKLEVEFNPAPAISNEASLSKPNFEKPQLKKITFHDIELRQEKANVNRPIGQVFLTSDNELAIQTGSGIILPRKLQLEGKTVVSVREFLSGYPQLIGVILE